ncbi:hypothetical protein EAH79_07860 [Sphingomonas koreensis]|nr:hypothetical protein EAH79_07860 [Sphingomonas koreensis]
MTQNYHQMCLQVVAALRASNDGAAQDRGARRSFANLIGARNGKSVLIPVAAAVAIANFGEVWLANHPGLLHRLSVKDTNALVRRAFADAIVAANFAAKPAEIAINISGAVVRQLAAKRTDGEKLSQENLRRRSE